MDAYTRAAERSGEVVSHRSAVEVNPGAQVSAALVADRIALCRDIVLGMKVVLELSERAAIEATCEPPRPHLSVFDTGALERMAIQTARLLDANLEAFAEQLQDLPPAEVH